MSKIIAILLIIFLCVADIFFVRIGLLPVEPSLSLIPLFVICSVFYHKNVLIRLFEAPNSKFLFGIILLSFFFSIFSISEKITYAISNHLITFAIYSLSFLFFKQKKGGREIFLLAFLVLSISLVYDLLFSGSGVVRGAGFAENPNNAALRIIILFVALSTFIHKKANFIVLLIITFIIVFLTLSRSGIIIFTISFLILVPHKFSKLMNVSQLPKQLIKLLPLFIFLFYFMMLISPYIVELVPAFEHRGATQRINLILNQEGFVSDRDIEQGGRIEILQTYLNMFVDNPLGYGTGMSMGADLYYKATHNMFLRIMIDYGIIGLLFYIALIANGFIKSIKNNHFYGIAFFLVLFVASFFTNTLLENRTFIITLAFIDAHYRQTIKSS